MRDRLLKRLQQGQLGQAETFVVLWTYFQQAGLTDVEEDFHREGRVPHEYARKFRKDVAHKDIERQTLPQRFSLLQPHIRHPAAFNGAAIDLFVLLDLYLGTEDAEVYEDTLFPGFNRRKRYRLKRRNNFIADTLYDVDELVTWESEQAESLAAYAIDHMVIPAKSPGQIEIKCLTRSSWASKELHDRLLLERKQLKVMMWPIHRLCIQYADIDTKFPSLKEVKNEPALEQDAMAALIEAERQRVTLLILPELAIPPRIEVRIQEQLARHGPDGHPTLTLLGRCHRRVSGDLDANEAVLLGPDGTELLIHRKCVPFSFRNNSDEAVSERLARGRHLTVVESAIGNLVPLICLDLLNTAVQDLVVQTHANLAAVPSLSPETAAHRTAATVLQVRKLASTFVANRWMDDPPRLSEKNTSFFRTPCRQNSLVTHVSQDGHIPYLLFDLDRLLTPGRAGSMP